MSNTVRTHYRNSMLAFPNTTEYACAIERPPTRLADRVVTLMLWVGVIVVILATVFQGAPK